MKIGELAEKTQVSTQTVRFYEREGLISKAARAANGYREYGDEALGEMAFIRECQNAGFTLKEIRRLGGLDARWSSCCPEVSELLRGKAEAIEQKLAELKRARKLIAEMRVRCEDSPGTACPVLESLRV